MSFADIIDDFTTGSYSVARKTSNGYDIHGRALPGTPSTLTITASVQPLTGKDLMTLPEGQRSEQTQWLYTSTELRTGASASSPDIVTIDGEPWTVVSVETWRTPDETFYKCRVARRSVP